MLLLYSNGYQTPVCQVPDLNFQTAAVMSPVLKNEGQNSHAECQPRGCSQWKLISFPFSAQREGIHQFSFKLGAGGGEETLD